LTGPAETALVETAKARMIEKNVFMYFKDSFLTARARLCGCRPDYAASRRSQSISRKFPASKFCKGHFASGNRVAL
jgi:hypothetical protein